MRVSRQIGAVRAGVAIAAWPKRALASGPGRWMRLVLLHPKNAFVKRILISNFKVICTFLIFFMKFILSFSNQTNIVFSTLRLILLWRSVTFRLCSWLLHSPSDYPDKFSVKCELWTIFSTNCWTNFFCKYTKIHFCYPKFASSATAIRFSPDFNMSMD